MREAVVSSPLHVLKVLPLQGRGVCNSPISIVHASPCLRLPLTHHARIARCLPYPQRQTQLTQLHFSTHEEDEEDEPHDDEAELPRDVLAVPQGVCEAPVVLERANNTQHHFLFRPQDGRRAEARGPRQQHAVARRTN